MAPGWDPIQMDSATIWTNLTRKTFLLMSVPNRLFPRTGEGVGFRGRGDHFRSGPESARRLAKGTLSFRPFWDLKISTKNKKKQNKFILNDKELSMAMTMIFYPLLNPSLRPRPISGGEGGGHFEGLSRLLFKRAEKGFVREKKRGLLHLYVFER